MATRPLIRLNKLMASKGWGSRREADKYIAAGWIEVDGDIIDHLGAKVPEDANIKILPEAKKHINNSSTTVIFHKPLGVVSCQPESENQKPAIQLLTGPNFYTQRRKNERSTVKPIDFRSLGRLEPYKLSKLAVAGRLDVNSTGLLVFTQCGVTARSIIGPDSQMEKEYLVRIGDQRKHRNASTPSLLDIDSDEVQEMLYRLRQGIEDGDDFLTAKSVKVQNDQQLNFTLTQGKHHHIRRMCEAVGWRVQALKRVRIGNIHLGDLPKGKWRYLKTNEKF